MCLCSIFLRVFGKEEAGKGLLEVMKGEGLKERKILLEKVFEGIQVLEAKGEG